MLDYIPESLLYIVAYSWLFPTSDHLRFTADSSSAPRRTPPPTHAMDDSHGKYQDSKWGATRNMYSTVYRVTRTPVPVP